MINWTVKTSVNNAGKLSHLALSHQKGIKDFAHALISAPILQRAIDRGVDHASALAKGHDIGARRYNAVWKDLPKMVAAYIRTNVNPKDNITLVVMKVADDRGRDITHYYNLAKLSKDLTTAVDALR